MPDKIHSTANKVIYKLKFKQILGRTLHAAEQDSKKNRYFRDSFAGMKDSILSKIRNLSGNDIFVKH